MVRKSAGLERVDALDDDGLELLEHEARKMVERAKGRVSVMSKRGSKVNGAAQDDPSGLRAAGAKVAEDEKKAKATQTRLDLGDAQVVFEQLEFDVALSTTEAALKDHDAVSKLAEAGRRQIALDLLIELQVKPEKAKIADLQKQAAQLAKESQEMKHKVTRRTEVVYRPNTLSVHFFEPGSDRKIVVMQERRMTEAEIKSFEASGAPPPKTELEPVDPPPSTSAPTER